MIEKFKHKKIEYIAYILIGISLIYIFYDTMESVIHTNQKIKKHKLHDNPDNMNDLIKKLCKDDNCFTSMSITKLVKDMIHKNGLEYTVNSMIAEPKKYQTYNGDYVFIFRKIDDEKNGGYEALYHHHPGIHGVPTLEANKNMLDTCPSGKCDVVNVIREIGDFTNKNRHGFLDYTWYDPITHDTVIKRSYVEKLNNINYKGENIPIYIGSGHTLKAERDNIDKSLLLINIFSFLLFMFLWNILNIESLLKSSPYVKNIFFIIVTIIFSIMILKSKESIVKVEIQENRLEKRVIAGGILAGLTLSLSLFFRAFVNVGLKKDVSIAILKLFTVGFIGAILTLNDIPSERNFKNILIKTHIKNNFILISSIYFILSVLAIAINFK